MTVNELRQRFLDFFENKNHRIVPSSSLIPAADPTLLFTGSGMNQFKEYFLGYKKDTQRAASSQKCLRTDDLDKVGKTAGHHTFFEMLGNFSFGDYFKEEAILWAWEFMTGELNIPQAKLWISVYKDDDESYNIWEKKIGVAREKIIRLGAEDNFWPANAPAVGPNGPCGPCSEIFYDHGLDFGCQKPECNVSCNCGRFVEVWNLVFTQYDRKGVNELQPLPSKNIDTGMGLERMAAVLQGKKSNFEIDIFEDIIKAIEKNIHIARSSTKRPVGNEEHLRTIADHARAVVFAICDGVLPSNEERGYIVRKLIRRAFLRAKALRNEEPFIYKIVPTIASVMKEPYPELARRRENIASIILAEEKRFKGTLREGTRILTDMIEGLKKEGKKTLSGEAAFNLYDTYGFPLELTESICTDCNFSVEKEEFKIAMDKQRQRSKSKSQIAEGIFASKEGIDSIIGKMKLPSLKKAPEAGEIRKTKVVLILKGEERIEEAVKGEKIGFILKETPFYGEAGGQIGDRGKVTNDSVELDVLDTKIFSKETTVHIAAVIKGKINSGDIVTASIDQDYRNAIRRSHTATHLLQAALRQVLGSHVEQSGSWVGPDRLRFDFTHFKALSERELSRVEEVVNENIARNDEVNPKRMTLNQAKEEGALAFFGEKYEDAVTVLSISDYSKEFCGGTHVNFTGKIRLFYITQEGSIASGIRRIEAVTGNLAYSSTRDDKQLINDALKVLHISQKEKVIPALEEIYADKKDLEKRIKNLDLERGKSLLNDILAQAKEIDGTKIVGHKIDKADFKLLRNLADLVMEKTKSCVVSLVSNAGEKVFLIVALTPDLVSRKLDARKIIDTLAEIIGGRGGGRADFAQAGGKDPSQIDKLLKQLPKIVERDFKK